MTHYGESLREVNDLTVSEIERVIRAHGLTSVDVRTYWTESRERATDGDCLADWLGY